MVNRVRPKHVAVVDWVGDPPRSGTNTYVPYDTSGTVQTGTFTHDVSRIPSGMVVVDGYMIVVSNPEDSPGTSTFLVFDLSDNNQEISVGSEADPGDAAAVGAKDDMVYTLGRGSDAFVRVHDVQRAVLLPMRSLAYRVLARLTSMRSLRYNIDGISAFVRSIAYSITGRLTPARSLAYRITGRLSPTRSIGYRVLDQLTGTRSLRYRVLDQLTATRSLAYRILDQITGSRSLAYAITGRLTATRSLAYDIDGIAAFVRSLAYAVESRLTPSRSLAYGVLQRVGERVTTTTMSSLNGLTRNSAADTTVTLPTTNNQRGSVWWENLWRISSGAAIHAYDADFTAVSGDDITVSALTAVWGLTTDGTDLIAVGQASDNTFHLVVIDPSGTVTSDVEISIPSGYTGTPSVAYDSVTTAVWVAWARGFSESTLFKPYSKVGVALTGEFNGAAANSRPDGMVAFNGYLISANRLGSARRMYAYDVSDGTQVAAVDDAITVPPTSMGLKDDMLYVFERNVTSTDVLVWDIDYTAPALVTVITPPSKSLVYSITGRLFATRSLRYNIGGISAFARSLAYSITGRITSSRSLRYRVLGRLTGTRSLAYRITGRLTSTRSLAYRITGRLTSTRSLAYRIDGIAAFVRSLSYGILAQITPTRSLGYRILDQITDTKSLAYRVLARLTSTRSLAYAIEARLSTTRSLAYGIIGRLELTRSLRYHINFVPLQAYRITRTIPTLIKRNMRSAATPGRITRTVAYTIKRTMRLIR